MIQLIESPMNTKSIASLFVLLAIVSVAVTVPSAYAAHADEAHVTMAIGSGIAGCEETAEGCFIPSTVTIAAGGHVEWENTDEMMHFATSGTDMVPDGVFDSSMMNPGATFSFTFNDAGTYPYYCMVHPWMVGTVIVEDEHGGDDHHDEAEAESHDMSGMEMAEESTPSVVDIQIDVPATASTGDRVPIDIKFVDGMGMGTEHVNYDIKVTHGGETLIDETGVHDHHGEGSHETPALTSDASDENPIEVVVTFQGFGFPGDMKTGPIGTTSNAQVVPEFGTIAAMILAVAIVSIIAVTAKSRLSIMPRL